MMLLKYCTQYANKFGKLHRSHRTGKGQFLFQSQRREMLKNVQTTIKLCSFHLLTRLSSKCFKLGLSSIGTENFQMYKLGFQDAEEAEMKLPTFVGSQRKQGNSRKTSAFASWFMLIPLSVWVTTNWKILKEMGL